jgi:hypothetical protein
MGYGSTDKLLPWDIYPADRAPPGPAENTFASFSAHLVSLTRVKRQGMATGMTGMAQGLAALEPLQTPSTAGSWTPLLQQAPNLKACGLPQGPAWNHPDVRRYETHTKQKAGLPTLY